MSAKITSFHALSQTQWPAQGSRSWSSHACWLLIRAWPAFSHQMMRSWSDHSVFKDVISNDNKKRIHNQMWQAVGKPWQRCVACHRRDDQYRGQGAGAAAGGDATSWQPGSPGAFARPPAQLRTVRSPTRQPMSSLSLHHLKPCTRGTHCAVPDTGVLICHTKAATGRPQMHAHPW